MSPRARRRALPLAVALAALGGTLACEPVYEGPQLTDVPEGLAYTTGLEAARKPLPGRKANSQVGHVPPGGTSWDTSAVITTYEGRAGREELEAARDDYARRYRTTQYGPVEPMTIGGRPGWAYTTSEETREGRKTTGLVGLVPWDSVSYSIELRTSDPRWQEPERQRAIVASFEVARRGRHKPALYALLAAVLAGWGVAAALRRRAGTP